MRTKFFAIFALAALSMPAIAQADGVINLYTARHYDTDERLYSDFEEKTGIKLNRIEDSPSALIARIRAEGRASPADVFLVTDAGRLWTAEEAGLFQAVESAVLEERIPAHLQHPDNLWFGFSTRARIIFYDKARINPDDLKSYLDLADPKFKDQICTRSSSNVYMVSLLAAMIAHYGEEEAEAWVRGMWENRARDPEGGDTDQLKSIVSGQCAIAVANTYYFARSLHSDVVGLAHPEQTDKIGWVFPDQDGVGTHVNVSGGGLLVHSPNTENGKKFLEYLASDSAQAYFASGNDEYPVVEGASISSAVESLGTFKADTLNLSALGTNQAKAIEIYSKVGYQ